MRDIRDAEQKGSGNLVRVYLNNCIKPRLEKDDGSEQRVKMSWWNTNKENARRIALAKVVYPRLPCAELLRGIHPGMKGTVPSCLRSTSLNLKNLQYYTRKPIPKFLSHSEMSVQLFCRRPRGLHPRWSAAQVGPAASPLIFCCTAEISTAQ